MGSLDKGTNVSVVSTVGKCKSKVVEIPATATPAQMEAALDAHLNNDWNLVTFFQLGTKTFVIMVKNI